MAKVELELTEETLRMVKRSAENSHATLENWLTHAIERSAKQATEDQILGLFSQEPELMDSLSEQAMTAREQHPLRQG